MLVCMAIYGRFGGKVTIVRRATLDDVTKFEKRKPDQQDRDAILIGSYVIAKEVDTGKERLYSQAFLRADRGSVEIGEEIDGLPPETPGRIYVND
jgi:hypothetical protein